MAVVYQMGDKLPSHVRQPTDKYKTKHTMYLADSADQWDIYCRTYVPASYFTYSEPRIIT